MRYSFLILLLLAIFSLFYLVRRIKTRKQYFPDSILKLVGSGVIVEICHVVIMLSAQIHISAVAYCVYLAATEWMGYYLLLFSLEYIGEANHDFFKKPMAIGLILADNISLAVNIFTGHYFTLKQFSEETGHFWYVMDLNPAFFIHLTWAYALISMSIACMVYKSFLSSSIYRKKFLFMLIILGFVGFFDSCYVFYGWPCNLSVPLYSVVGFVVYYFSIRYVPKGLINDTLGLVIDRSLYGVVIEEDDGRRIYTNATAKKYLSVTPELNTVMNSWRNSNRSEKLAFKEVHNYFEDDEGKKVYYNLRFNRITDKEGKYIGDLYVLTDETKVVAKRDEERYISMHDPLTGLYRKDYFFIKVKEELAAFPDKNYFLVMLDINNFKLINDLFGYEKGNDILKHVADKLKDITVTGDVYGYLGDDHFAILLPAERFSMDMFANMSINDLLITREYAYNVRLYTGIYRVTDRTLEPHVMCDRAYMAIQTLKGTYDRQLVFYDENIRENILQEQRIVSEIDVALETGQIELFVQPQTDSSGEVLGGEILVQWMHPEKGLIMPSGFVPVLEEKGLIHKLDKYVWENACMYLKRWKELGREDLYLSVNISPKDLYMFDIYKVFTELVEKYGISPKNLNLELTESAIMLDVKRQVELIKKLQSYGFVVELDDFGSGYSSLNMLKDISVDTLKIDMEFLNGSDGERGREIIRAIIEMAKHLGITVVCEGVETYDQMKFLKRVGCDIFQGYFFSRSMDIARFEDMYLKEE